MASGNLFLEHSMAEVPAAVDLVTCGDITYTVVSSFWA